jgi:hypothetical protein
LKNSSPYRESPLLLLQNPQKKIKIGTLLSVATAPEKQQLYQKSKFSDLCCTLLHFFQTCNNIISNNEK